MSTVPTTTKMTTNLPEAATRTGAPRGRRPWTAGFSMIELLTVIAIIAILAAFLFPVFGKVRESARQATCMSNLHDVYFQVRQFELDRHRYPDYLLGPALDANGCKVGGDGTDCGGGSPGAAISPEAVSALLNHAPDSNPATAWNYAKGNYLNSLYPAYVKSLATFHCPDNTQYDNAAAATAVPVQRLQTTPPASSASSLVTYYSYPYDSYDASPQVDPNSAQIGGAKLLPITNGTPALVRYTRLWQPVLTTPPAGTADGTHDTAVEYANQLIWREPSGDTLITWCPFHADKNGKAIVLFLNGTAKSVDVLKLKNSTPNSGPDAVAQDFDAYKLLPTD